MRGEMVCQKDSLCIGNFGRKHGETLSCEAELLVRHGGHVTEKVSTIHLHSRQQGPLTHHTSVWKKKC